MPEISVIVPVYNVEKYLDRCVRSVLAQSFRDFELILVDDGSPDRCPALCDGYAEKDSRVHVIHRENGGLSAARNSGIDYVMEKSRSRWIAFLDSDDWIHRDFLRCLYLGTEDPRVGISVCGFERVTSQKEEQPVSSQAPVILEPEKAYTEDYGLCMTACCKLIRRDLLENLRFPLGKLHEDAFVTHLLVFGGERVAVFPQNLYYYYFNPDSITRKTWTPKRLQELEGHQVRLEYLKEHGYALAERAERSTIVFTIYEHIETLAQLHDPAYASYLRDLRRQLREAIRAEKGLIPLNRETFWLYLMAWPGKPLWHLLKKAQQWWHRRNGSES